MVKQNNTKKEKWKTLQQLAVNSSGKGERGLMMDPERRILTPQSNCKAIK